MNNDYIFEPTLNLDLPYIKDLAERVQNLITAGMVSHARAVSDDPYMSELRERIPILSSTFNVYTNRPGGKIPLHIDAKRQCTLNIPISGTEDSHTIFYKFIGDSKLEFNPATIYHDIKSPVEEVFRFTLLRPTLLNTSVPHMVTNQTTTKTRFVLSWSILEDISFEEAREYFTSHRDL